MREQLRPVTEFQVPKLRYEIEAVLNPYGM